MIMKKVLLMLVALVATVTVSADAEKDGWTKSFAPVKDQADLAGLHTAVAGDGSVYASSTFDQDFQFAEKTVAADADGMLSSCIVKYDKEGAEQWAITLAGSCNITTMTADNNGILYAAGYSEDSKIVVTDAKGNTTELADPAAFVVKISKDGQIEKNLQVKPEAPSELYYFGEMYVRPSKIVLDGDKIYVSCHYQGEVKSLGWEGRYVTMLDFDTFETSYLGDITSVGLFSAKSSDLTEPTSLACLQATGNADLLDEAAIQCAPEAFTFVVSGGEIDVIFIGWGKLTLSTSATTNRNFEFEMKGEGVNEHALVAAHLSDIDKKYRIFNATPYDNQGFSNYKLMSDITGTDNVIVGGTFYGSYPLDEKVIKETNTSFVASFSLTTAEMHWQLPNEVESEATCMIVTDEEIHASTNVATYTIKTATGELKADMTENKSYADAAAYDNTYVSTIAVEDEVVDQQTQEITTPAKVVVFSPKMNTSAINAAKVATAKGAAQFFNLNGQRVAAPQKGLYIVNGQKVVIK